MDETLKALSLNIASHIDEFDDVFACGAPSLRWIVEHSIAGLADASLIEAHLSDWRQIISGAPEAFQVDCPDFVEKAARASGMTAAR